MVLLCLVCNFQFVFQVDPFLLIAGIKSKKEYFEDILLTNFSVEEIEACHGFLQNINKTLADGSVGKLTQQIFPGRGRF